MICIHLEPERVHEQFTGSRMMFYDPYGLGPQGS
jgi:hypothetical protein